MIAELSRRYEISRLPEMEGSKPKAAFKAYPIGFFHIDIAEVRTEEAKLRLLVAIDRTSKFAFAELHERVTQRIAADFLRRLPGAVPYRIHTVLTDNGTHFTEPTGDGWKPANIRRMRAAGEPFRCHSFELACAELEIEHQLTKPNHPWTNDQVERMNRTLEEATVRRYHYETHDAPRDTMLEDLPRDDRTYASFLYGSIGIVADRGDRRDRIALDLGVVGPASQADHVQGFVHDVIGARRPEGWDHQLKSELAIRLIYERKHRSFRHIGLGVRGLEADVAPHVNFALGNVDTLAGADLTVRVGDRLGEIYGPACVCPPVVEPGLYPRSDGFGWYLFARADARLMGRNIFVEGNTFRDGPGVEPEGVVGDLQAGVALQYNAFELSYTYVVRSPEHRGQTSFAKFGLLKLRFRY